MISILVVDDHPLMRAGLQCMLDATDDMRVIGSAGDGQEAVELASALHPDIVLMDLCMPRMDGIEATRLLRDLEPSTAVVVLTSSCVPALVQDAIAAGAAGFLLKDMAPERLLDALRGLQAGAPAMDARAARILARLQRRAASEALRTAPAPSA